jgi:hypothetical protein
MSAAMLGAQSPSHDSGSKSPEPGKSGASANAAAVMFTGCLSPRSKSDEVYLTSAKQKGVKDAPATVKLVPATKKVNLDTFATQTVEVTGTLDQSGPSSAPAGGPGATPVLTVTKIKASADGC